MSLLSAFQLSCLNKSELQFLLASKFNALAYFAPGSIEDLRLRLAITQLQRELSNR